MMEPDVELEFETEDDDVDQSVQRRDEDPVRWEAEDPRNVVPMTRERKLELADWVVDTCIAFGTSIHTAFHIAAYFIEALVQDGLCEDVGDSTTGAT